MATRHLKPREVSVDIKEQRRLLTGNPSQAKMNRMVIGPTMVTGVIMRFLVGKGPNDAEWKSEAKRTKLGGKYSFTYYTRPSGHRVSAASIRNTDTGALANCHRVLKATSKFVKVGPGVKGKDGVARKIMQREAKYGNFAIGWDAPLRRILNAEIQAFVDEIAMGGTPRYLPKSKIKMRVK